VANYFSTVVEHYELGGTHFESTPGYEYYASAAEFIASAGLETMAEMYVGVNTYGTPAEIVEQLRNQREILDHDIDVLQIVKYGGMTQAEAESSMRLFSSEVVPALRG
jgi:hypothetical protein